MGDIKLFYNKLLRFGDGWSVFEVNIDEKMMRVDVYVKYDLAYGPCSETGELYKVYDYRQEREWRHLDSLGYATYVHCRLPRIKDSSGHIKTIGVQWLVAGASHTAHFENRCVAILQGTHNRLQAARLMNTSEDMICGIMHSAVSRGLERRDLDKEPVKQLCIDEKSIGKGQKYMSILSNGQTGAVLEAAAGRDSGSVAALIDKTFSPEQLKGITEVCCDMWDAFMTTLKKSVRMQNWSTINSM